MGFGPKAPSVDSGVQAVKDLIELLYPERATPAVLELFAASARALLTAKAALSFENIQRFWQDPEWREWIQSRWQTPFDGPWDRFPGTVVNPADLDADFGWLIADRIRATEAFLDSNNGPEP